MLGLARHVQVRREHRRQQRDQTRAPTRAASHGSSTPTPPAISATPLTCTIRLACPRSAGGTICSYARGITKWLTPAPMKTPPAAAAKHCPGANAALLLLWLLHL